MRSASARTEWSPDRYRLAAFRLLAHVVSRTARQTSLAIHVQLAGKPHSSPREVYAANVSIHVTIAIYVFTWIVLRYDPSPLASVAIAAGCLLFAPLVPSVTIPTLAISIGLAGRLVRPIGRIDPQAIQNPIHWILLLGASAYVTRVPLATRWVGWFWIVAAAINALAALALWIVRPSAPGGTPSAA